MGCSVVAVRVMKYSKQRLVSQYQELEACGQVIIIPVLYWCLGSEMTFLLNLSTISNGSWDGVSETFLLILVILNVCHTEVILPK
jgi:hypothetical protein